MVAFGAATACAQSRNEEASNKPPNWTICVDRETSWGGRVEDVQQVFQSAARQLCPHFPGRQLSPIVVKPNGGPKVLYQRGPKGEYTVLLNTGDRLWAQHAYQFAHELAHILCNYTAQEHPHRWFEESLCELASLFVLRRMSAEWAANPPYPNWRDYASALDSYAGDRLKQAQLPPGKSLAEWYREESPRLAADACLRDKNTIAAAALLPRFEASPESWEAIAYLNSSEPHDAKDFAEFLQQWCDRCPEKHRLFVRQLAREFGIVISPDD